MSTRRVRKITVAQIERAIGIIGDIAEHADLDGEERDALGATIHALDQIAADGGITIQPVPAATTD